MVDRGRIRGIAVPFQYTDAGYPRPSMDAELLQDSIFTILSTVPGERRMRPYFGCYLTRFVHENMSIAEGYRARSEVRRAIETFEPRVTIDAINFSLDETRRVMEIIIEWSQNGLDLVRTVLEVSV